MINNSFTPQDRQQVHLHRSPCTGGSAIKRLKRDKRGISYAIVFMLGLIIVVIIVSNVFLWNFSMNELDWEKMKEDIVVTDVAKVNSSSWFTAQNEYSVMTGNLVGGSFPDTQAVDDDRWETFQEDQPPIVPGTLDLTGDFKLDVSAYPLTSIRGVEVQMTYRATDTGEKWYIEAFNWTSMTYSSSGFNNTDGSTPTGGWDQYSVNLTSGWNSYVSSNGTIDLRFHDSGLDSEQTSVDIDFIGVRATLDGAEFAFRNRGSTTAHLVSLWIDDSTLHVRYDVEIFINGGETTRYLRSDISLPEKPFTVKAVSERGNIAVYSPS